MSNKKTLTEGRLREALQRLLDGNPTRTKMTGKLTLNKINNEAGLSQSYIHKFPTFVNYATPIIDKHNENRCQSVEGDFLGQNNTLSEVEKLKIDIQREEKLKKKYKQERDDARKIKVILESEYNTLMFRLYELQDELRHYKTTPIAK